ncbi:MAG: DUF4125 family protein [Oscillospiraceae bacterium]|nr:DUF4125 family protein [Oscillospiraceae bacterium]
MTLFEKKEALIKEEWENFHAVQNEGGKADCQNNPETFAVMRRAQFTAWGEELVESWHKDLLDAKAQGRNLLSEKYAWMMRQTAPYEFRLISKYLHFPTILAEEMMEEIIETEVYWMEQYEKQYPYMASGNRPVRSKMDTEYETSFETYLRGELHTYSEHTLKLYLDMVRNLKKEGKSLSLIIMDAMVKAYGYKDIDNAERQQKIRTMSNI